MDAVEPTRPVSKATRPVPLLPNITDSSPIESASVDDAIAPMDVEESSRDLDAEPIPTAPCASEVSSDNFASTIASMVGI